MGDDPAVKTDTAARTFTMSLDIDATPEEVWRALTEATELVRWFPLQARVTPGQGGTMFWGWDDRWAWESQIDAWEPGKRLRLVENRPAFDAKGEPLAEPSRKMAMEFTLETHAGRTRLRLVHSGFGHGANWDDELESVSSGWQFELRGLRHYLERHKGRDRHHGMANRVTSLDIDTIWKRLLSPAAFTLTEGRLEANERVVIRTATGDQFAGTVAWLNAGRDLFVVVDDLDAGIFRIAIWRAVGETGVQVWAATYDSRHAARVRELGLQIQGLLDRLLT
jgi:uncharacterized protein YndB with AHSA1/START domain